MRGARLRELNVRRRRTNVKGARPPGQNNGHQARQPVKLASDAQGAGVGLVRVSRGAWQRAVECRDDVEQAEEGRFCLRKVRARSHDGRGAAGSCGGESVCVYV